MEPIRDTSTDVGNLLGGIARCRVRAPLDVVSWKLMPSTHLEIMWRDVQKTDAPEDFKNNCLKLIGGHWKKLKSRVKSEYFTPNKDDPVKLLIPPTDSQVDPNQWPTLVDYWQREDVQAQSNRKQLEILPRTGRTSHANIREKMKANNEDISIAKVFIKTRSKNDGTRPDHGTRMLVEMMNEKLNEVPQSEQSDPFKEQVFSDLLGFEGHGRVRTFGVGPSPRDVFVARLSSMNTTSGDAIKMMVQSQVEAQLEAKVAERVAEKVSHYEKKNQVELLDRIKRMHHLLVLEGLLPPSQCNETRRSRSSLRQVQTPSNES